MKTKFLAIISIVTFIISFFLSCLDLNCFNRSFYHSQYKKLDIASEVKMSYEDLMYSTEKLLDYVQDIESDLFVEATINNEVREVFNKREKDHMVDVKNLYLNAMQVRNISLIISVISLILFIVLNKKDRLLILADNYLKTLMIFSFLFVFLIVYLLLDFSSFWTNFHQVFFSNDLWLLDPRVDVLIQMVPESFFNQLVINITVSFIGVIVVLAILCYLYRKRALSND